MRKQKSIFQAATVGAARGFTLLEIMVVIAIIGLLATAVSVGVMSYLKKAKVQTCKIQLNTIAQAINNYYLEENDYPSSLEDLTKGHNAPLKEKQLKDPWGQEFIYSTSTHGEADFTLCSKGPDKREGTDDDICYK